MNNENKKLIWCFREERSGGFWFCDSLSKFLDLEDYYQETISKFKEKIKDSPDKNYIFSTHTFNFLQNLDEFNCETILLRLSRRDKIEQFLSYLIMDKTNAAFANLRKIATIRKDNFLKSTKFFKLKISKGHFLDYIKMQSERKVLWEKYSKKYNSEHLYYEDFYEGVNIPSLGIKNLNFKNSKSVFMKLPYAKEKKEYFENYEEICEWFAEYSKFL